MKKIFVVGMGMAAGDLTDRQMAIIRSAQMLIGGRRHLAQFADLPVEKKAITGDVEKTIAMIKALRQDRRVVILASGDPLFFGIGSKITQALGKEKVVVMPNITSVAAAFARINEPWNEARIISLHGRNRKYEVLQALTSENPVAVLTDHRQTPQWLGRWLIDKGADRLKMVVFENLGSSEETFGWYTPAQAAEKHFLQPNVVIIIPPEEEKLVENLKLGMPEEAYIHERGLITKPEVRAVTLAKLGLEPGQTLWDLGAGSGSVGIEASLLLGAGRVIAVEKKTARVAHIRQNARRYGLFNHEVYETELPDGLDGMPAPDRIFIGGGGQNLTSIVASALDFLKPGGIIVINTVLLDNLSRIVDTIKAQGLAVEIVQLQVCKSKEMPWSLRLQALNPVWIITGVR